MSGPAKRWLSIISLATIVAVAPTRAKTDEEFDNAKYKLQLNGWVSQPSGYFNGKGGDGYFDLQKDFGFGNYATFSGRIDWRFKRKHHLVFAVTPVISSRTSTLMRTVIWQGQTYDIGAQVNADIKSLFFAPGYQYDFFRKKQGWLGLLVNCNLAYTEASLKATGSVSGVGTAGVHSSGSRFAPLPAIGPDFRWCPIPDNGRFYLDGMFTRSSAMEISCPRGRISDFPSGSAGMRELDI
jgi:hypothetical protein